MEQYSKNDLIALLPMPAKDANKYSRGKLTLYGGSLRYPGAVALSAMASQRTGAGYTEVFTAPTVVGVVQSSRPSLVVRSWKEIQEAPLSATTSEKPCAFVVGTGFDASKRSSSSITHFVLKKAQAPVLVDGGGLDALASKEGCALCESRFIDGYPTIITPHGGEAQRLAKVFDLATEDFAHLAYTLSLAYGVTTVLKGPETYISDGEEIFVINSGTPALAKAGTGDVLSGIIGALLAQGLAPLDAAVLGVSLHAKAGCIAALDLTEISVLAEDVIDYIPKAIKNLMNSRLPSDLPRTVSRKEA